jgi:hypothetical protein
MNPVGRGVALTRSGEGCGGGTGPGGHAASLAILTVHWDDIPDTAMASRPRACGIAAAAAEQSVGGVTTGRRDVATVASAH